MTLPCDIRHITVDHIVENGFGNLETKFQSTHPVHSSPDLGNPSPAFVLRSPNHSVTIRGIKHLCLMPHIVSSYSVKLTHSTMYVLQMNAFKAITIRAFPNIIYHTRKDRNVINAEHHFRVIPKSQKAVDSIIHSLT